MRQAARLLGPLLLSALGVSAVAGCGGPSGRRPGPVITEDAGVAALGRAIDAVNASRRELLDDAAAVSAGARALDEGDALAAAGNRAGMQAARGRIEAAAGAATSANQRLPARLAGYAGAIGALDAASAARALDADQRAAVLLVVRAGRVEHAAATRYAQRAAVAWSRYTLLAADQSTWFTRARAGWYRNAKESADAYAVLVSDERPALDAARAALAEADAARAAAVATTSTAIAGARAVLVDLEEGPD